MSTPSFASAAIPLGDTGKIAGRVLDSVTGEALIGVNVVLSSDGSDTITGTVTDSDGCYSMINIKPGTYQSMLKERLEASGFNPQRQLTLSQQEIVPLRAALSPDAVLATYTWRGESRSFTVGEYVFWLETLPVNEMYYRAGASMGRALRNEVFALNGEREGLENDPTYKENMWHVGTVRLASRLQQEAIDRYTGQPTEEQNADAAQRMKLLSVQERWADLQTIQFDAVDDARKAEVEEGLRVDE